MAKQVIIIGDGVAGLLGRWPWQMLVSLLH